MCINIRKRKEKFTMKKSKILSLLFCASALTLAGCNGGGDTSSAPEGSTSDVPASTSGSVDPSGSSSSVAPVPTDWSAEIKSQMTSLLDGHVLPFVNANWELANIGLRFGVMAYDEVLTSEKLAELYSDYTESTAITGADYCFEKETEHGTVAVGILSGTQQGKKAVAIAASYSGTVTEWAAPDLTKMEQYGGAVYPFPGGEWYTPYANTSGAVITYSVSESQTEDSVAAAFREAGFLVAVASDEDGYEFTKASGTKFANGYIYTRVVDTIRRVIILGKLGSTPYVTDEFSVSANLSEVNPGGEVTLTVSARAYTETPVITVSPENAATFVEEKSSGNTFVYSISESVEAETVITFTASLPVAEKEGSVEVTVVTEKADWTADEKALMAEAFSFELPFFGADWVFELVGEDKNPVAHADVTGATEAVEAALLGAGFVKWQAGYAKFGFEGSVLFTLGVSEDESSTSVGIKLVNFPAEGWSADEKAMMTEKFGIEFPYFLGADVFTPLYWDEAKSAITTTAATVSALDYAMMFLNAGYSVYYGDSGKTWLYTEFDVGPFTSRTTIRIEFHPVVSGADGSCDIVMSASTVENTQTATFPADVLAEQMKAVAAEPEYEYVAPSYDGAESYYYHYDIDEKGRLTFVIIVDLGEGGSATGAMDTYINALTALGYIDGRPHGLAGFISPDYFFMVVVEAISDTVFQITVM